MWTTTLFAQVGGLAGVAKGEDGQPLVGYTILIERQEVKGNYKTKTNKRGEYMHIGLPIGDYKITLVDPQGRALFWVMQRVGLGDNTEVNIDLQKEKVRQKQEEARQLAANPELARAKEEQEREQKQFTGLKALFDQGQLLYNEKRYGEAAAMFEQALPLAKDKNVPIILARLGDAYHKTRDYDKAVDCYQKAIQANPSDASVHNNLGNVYAEQGKVAEAQAEFRKAAELDPAGAARYYFNLGATLYNTGKMDDAAEAFKKATELDPTYADAYFWHGQALMGKASMTDDGKVVAVPGTVEALEAYLKLEPEGKNAATAQALLQTIRGKVDTQYKAPKKEKKKG